jgi:hypothetical protein
MLGTSIKNNNDNDGESMSEHSGQSQPDAAAEAVSPPSAARPQRRITLALLDQYTAAHEARGYDPYDTGNRQRDAWASKPKRA